VGATFSAPPSLYQLWVFWIRRVWSESIDPAVVSLHAASERRPSPILRNVPQRGKEVHSTTSHTQHKWASTIDKFKNGCQTLTWSCHHFQAFLEILVHQASSGGGRRKPTGRVMCRCAQFTVWWEPLICMHLLAVLYKYINSVRTCLLANILIV
jgi:hypothetical protein